MPTPIPHSFGARVLRRRHGFVVPAFAAAMAISTLTRLALLLKAAGELSWNWTLPGAFLSGLVFDLGAAAWLMLPLIVLLAALPRRTFEFRAGSWIAQASFFVYLAVLLFGGVAEWLFWDEFGARFNFIAVDYLVYTHEVVGNIRESYPLPWIFGGIFLAACVAAALVRRDGWLDRIGTFATESAGRRWRAAAAWGAVCLAVGLALNEGQLPAFQNNFNRELAKNGVWSLFAAFRHNELNYDQFYSTLPLDDAFAQIHAELAADGSQRLGDSPHDTLRLVRHDGVELHPNVIQITVESLSADFLSTFNRASQLTPHLTALAEKSLVFNRLYATGTRTDRGMEALTLAMPPTPGRSLVKRPHNENLFTLGSVFRDRGYDTAFLYGGFGYFDNMNHFFGANGYRVIDRAAVAKSDVTFANAWGACDEDLYRWTLREADADHAAGKPFHFFIMTTSNHRPYTYPEGRIDLPPKVSGRAGAVKYTDYAIGKFLADAADKPWFRNTVFVIVADHCASVAGRSTLPVQNYHIPLFIYAPGGQIAPGEVNELMSQVDYAPTLLGLLHWTYASRFYGWDVLSAKGDRRALIGNYQQLGLYEPGELTILQPRQRVSRFALDERDYSLSPGGAEDETSETIAYYQTASFLYRTGGYHALTPEEHRRSLAVLVPAPGDVTLAAHNATTGATP